jgi:hypothetical protein
VCIDRKENNSVLYQPSYSSVKASFEGYLSKAELEFSSLYLNMESSACGVKGKFQA